MTDPQSDRKAPPANLLILTAIVTVMVTVFTLDWMGKIRHSETGNALVVGEYKGILIQPGESYRLSGKPAVIKAECLNGYIVFASTTDSRMKALIVDYKNRPVLCPKETFTPPDTTP